MARRDISRPELLPSGGEEEGSPVLGVCGGVWWGGRCVCVMNPADPR